MMMSAVPARSICALLIALLLWLVALGASTFVGAHEFWLAHDAFSELEDN